MASVVAVTRQPLQVAVRAPRPAPQLGAPVEVVAGAAVVELEVAAAVAVLAQQPLTFERPAVVAVVAAGVPVVGQDLVVLAPSPLAAVKR